jgi:membrane-associated phospholipid phosphatase
MKKDKPYLKWFREAKKIKDQPSFPRLFGLGFGLVLFILILPDWMRFIFWNGLLAHRFLAGLLIVFCVLAVSLVWTAGQQVDTWGFLLFNLRGSRPAWLDWIMSGLTQLGSGFGALAIVLILSLTGFRRFAYEIVLGSFILWLVVELIKFFAHRSRPFVHLTQARIVGIQAIGRSFPSGHTCQAFFIATMITQYFNVSLWLGITLHLVALLVGITRMYVGAHYPRDVIAGAILGSAWGLMGMIIEGKGLINLG